MSTDLQSQLDTLRDDYAALQERHAELQRQLQEKESWSREWIDRRNRELKYEAHQQKKAETLQSVFYRIAERAAAGLTLHEFLRTVHTLLGELLYAKNCYVAMFNRAHNTLDYPYYVNEKDGATMPSQNVPLKRGMSELVLRACVPQLINADRLKELQNKGEIAEAWGDVSFSAWLGIPLMLHGAVGGVLAVQNYEPGGNYSAEDVHILQFVGNHVSSALERYQALDALRTSEERYRTVIENVGVGVGVVQDECLVFANPSLTRTTGYPAEALLRKPYLQIIHPDDLPTVREHHRRPASESAESAYACRVLTQSGQTRVLEVSTATITWAKREATLLFMVDITERQMAEETQRVALQKQVELTDMKTRFINMASHEFRTPLTGIQGSVELLLHYGERMTADKRRDMLTKIDDAAQHMTHMLENVLLIGRTDAGHLQFKPRPVHLARLCRKLSEEAHGAAPKQGEPVTVELHLPADDACWMLDEALLRNILGNLLSNAIKYSPHGGTVTLHVEHTAAQLTFRVQDSGIGIPEADQAHLFESFHRASNVGPIAGTGLGLSIVKEAVTYHKGTIAVHSQLGQGTCFTVALPATMASQN